MAKQRKFLTPAERLAKAEDDRNKVIAGETGKSYNLVEKAIGWESRSVELAEKASGARASAIAILQGIGYSEEQAAVKVEEFERTILIVSAEDGKAEAKA